MRDKVFTLIMIFILLGLSLCIVLDPMDIDAAHQNIFYKIETWIW